MKKVIKLSADDRKCLRIKNKVQEVLKEEGIGRFFISFPIGKEDFENVTWGVSLTQLKQIYLGMNATIKENMR